MYPDLMRLRWVKAFGRPGGEFLQHTRLRYISFGNRYYDICYVKDTISSSTLPFLWNLQTLYIKSDNDDSEIVLPSEIWMMPQLRHINITWAIYLTLWMLKMGTEWNPIAGEFLRLKFLLIKSCKLVRWTAEDVHFPSLEVLIMETMRNVGEIHSSIGDIATLKLIELRYCFGDIENSAKQILEEQRSNGNESLQVVIGGISL
ncbi:hypothetical protein Sango_0448100 [Sesamum angolense]|uniref:Uncharacterized protein n=1 Tax=Sesamum angolense TaxID=2727404 RepID=A0AAE1XB69_9LAMI|nr:hypothetical protein Sango_0448100 [Sesamum angolense]